jgi:hypothetical protein
MNEVRCPACGRRYRSLVRLHVSEPHREEVPDRGCGRVDLAGLELGLEAAKRTLGGRLAAPEATLRLSGLGLIRFDGQVASVDHAA